MYGALAGGLTSYNVGNGVGLKVSGFTTSASLKAPNLDKVATVSTSGIVIIGVNSCASDSNYIVTLADGFTYEKLETTHTFLGKLD